MYFVLTEITFMVTVSLNIIHGLKTKNGSLDLYVNFEDEQLQPNAIDHSVNFNFSLPAIKVYNKSSYNEKLLGNIYAPKLLGEKLQENYSEIEKGLKLNKFKMLHPLYLFQVNGLFNENLKKYDPSVPYTAYSDLNYITDGLDGFHMKDITTEKLIATDDNKIINNDKALYTEMLNNKNLLNSLPSNISDNLETLIISEILNELNEAKSRTEIKNFSKSEKSFNVTRVLVPTDLAVLDYSNENSEIHGMKRNDFSNDNYLFKRFCKSNNVSNYISSSNAVINKNISDFATLKTVADKFVKDEENITKILENLNEFGRTPNCTLPKRNIYSFYYKVTLKPEERSNIDNNRYIQNFPSVHVIQVSSLNMTGHLKPVILQVADSVHAYLNNSNQSLNKLVNVHYLPLYEIESFEKLSNNNQEFSLVTNYYNITSSVGTTDASIIMLNGGYGTVYAPLINQIKFSNTSFVTDLISSSSIPRISPEVSALDKSDKTIFLSSVTNLNFSNNLFLSSEISEVKNSTNSIYTVGILPINSSNSLSSPPDVLLNSGSNESFTNESSFSSPVLLSKVTKSLQNTHPIEILKNISYFSVVPSLTKTLTSNSSLTPIKDEDLFNTSSNTNSLTTVSLIGSTYFLERFYTIANISSTYAISNTNSSTVISTLTMNYNQSVKEINNNFSSTSVRENAINNGLTNPLAGETLINNSISELYRIHIPDINRTHRSAFPAPFRTEEFFNRSNIELDFCNIANRADRKIKKNLGKFHTLATKSASQTIKPVVSNVEIGKRLKASLKNNRKDSGIKHFYIHASQVTNNNLFFSSSDLDKFEDRRVFHFEETSAVSFTLQQERIRRNGTLKKLNFSNKKHSRGINRVKNRKMIKRIRKNDKFISSLHMNGILAETDNGNVLQNLLSDDEIASLNNRLNENLIDDEDHAKYFSKTRSTFYKDNSYTDLDLVNRHNRENLQSAENIGKSYYYYDDIDPVNSLKGKSPEIPTSKNIQGSITISFAHNNGEKEYNHDFHQQILEDEDNCLISCHPIRNNTTLFDFLVINYDVESATSSSLNSIRPKNTKKYSSSLSASTFRNKTNSKNKYYDKIKLFNRIGRVKKFNLTDFKKIIKEEDILKEKCETNGDKCVCSFNSELIDKNVSAASSISSGSICKSFVPLRNKFVITNDILPRIIKFDDKNNNSDEKIVDETNFLKFFMSSSSSNAKDEKGVKKKNKDIKVMVLLGSRIELTCTSNDTHNLAESNVAPKYSWNYGDNTPCCDGDQVLINRNGKLIIYSVTAQYDILACTFSFNDPDSQKVQNITTVYRLKVLMLPIFKVITKIHYHTTAPCNDTLLEMIELFLPQLIEKDICHYNENNEICYLTIKSAQCSKSREPEVTDLLVSYHTSLTPVKTLLTNKDDKLCNCLCLEMLSLKLFISLNRSVATAVTVPAETSTRAELIPIVHSISTLYSIGCGAGFQLDRTFCVACDVGTYSKEGSAYCHRCSRGMYQPKKGSGACIPCPNYFVPGCLSLVLETQSIAGTKWVLGILFFAIILIFSFFIYRKYFKKKRPSETAIPS